MTNSKYKLVKTDLFKNYNEEDLIKNQQGLDSKSNKLFDMPLNSLFGFFEAVYYIKEYNKNNQRILELHLISDKPFSKDEIAILQARLLVAYNKKFDYFEIYQEPESKFDSNKWINKRQAFDAAVTEKTDGDTIYRTIGKIKSFSTDINLHKYNDVVTIKDKNAKNNSLSRDEYGKRLFTRILKNAVQSKNYADFIVDKFELNDSELGYTIVIYIKSDDERISKFFDNSQMITQLFKDFFKKIKLVEVININELEDK